jgi:hypothetical protein
MLSTEICLAVDQAMATANITRQTARAIPAGRWSPFRIAPQPFTVDKHTAAMLQTIGPMLRDFYHAADQLYRLSLRREAPPFVHQYLDIGKPDWLLRVAQADSLQGQIPLIIRPDLLFTEQGLRATELDSVPGSMGLLSFLQLAYSQLGFSLLGETTTSQGWLDSLNSLPGDGGLTAIVISEECSGYRAETEWLAEQWRMSHPAAPITVFPEQLQLDEDGVWLNGCRVSRVYRFFELFDWENVPGAHALLHLAAVGKVVLTPPPKHYLEEKMWFAWLHHSGLEEYWRKLLAEDVFAALKELFPPTWLVTPDHAAVGAPPFGGWAKLKQSSRRQRPYVLKPSGFSPLAWGGHGFSRGKDYTTRQWAEQIDRLLAESERMPFILQTYQHSLPREVSFYHADDDETKQFQGKTRLCPYYFLLAADAKQPAQETVLFSGALATTVPMSKPVIHGMTEAVMSPTGLEVP